MGGGTGKASHWLTKEGGGIRQMLKMADKGGMGGLADADITEKNALKCAKIFFFY